MNLSHVVMDISFSNSTGQVDQNVGVASSTNAPVSTQTSQDYDESAMVAHMLQLKEDGQNAIPTQGFQTITQVFNLRVSSSSHYPLPAPSPRVTRAQKSKSKMPIRRFPRKSKK